MLTVKTIQRNIARKRRHQARLGATSASHTRDRSRDTHAQDALQRSEIERRTGTGSGEARHATIAFLVSGHIVL